MEKLPIKIQRDICQQIMSGCKDAREFFVDGNKLHNYFQNNFNPLKGETPEGELNRWLDWIKTCLNIHHFFVYAKNGYVFFKAPIAEVPVEDSQIYESDIFSDCCEPIGYYKKTSGVSKT